MYFFSIFAFFKSRGQFQYTEVNLINMFLLDIQNYKKNGIVVTMAANDPQIYSPVDRKSRREAEGASK